MNRPEKPVDWQHWPRAARRDFYDLRMNRAEVMADIAALTGVDVQQEYGPKSQFQKGELCAILVALESGDTRSSTFTHSSTP